MGTISDQEREIKRKRMIIVLNPAIAASNHNALSIVTLKGHLGSVLCRDPQIFSLVNTIRILLKLTQKMLQIDYMLCHKTSLKKFKKI